MATPRKNRGEYRVFYEAFFTGPDFLKLSPNSRQVLHTLKGLCGVLGIRCWPALIPALTFYTGRSNRAVSNAISELIETGWIEYSEPVVWVKRGLEFEPQLSPENHNHRKSVQDMASGLPNCDTVRRFKRHYAGFFGALDPAKVGYNGQGMGDAIPPSHHPEKEDGMGDPTTTPPPPPPITTPDAGAPGLLVLSPPGEAAAPKRRKSDSSLPPPLSDMHRDWEIKMGGCTEARFRKALGRMCRIPEPQRLPEMPTDSELKQALREYMAVAPSGRSSSFAMRVEKAGECIGAIARIVRQHPDDPLARSERVDSLVHGKHPLGRTG